MNITQTLEKLKLLEAAPADSRPTARLSDIDYEAVGKTKKATANNEFDSIIATLSGHTSKKFTVLGQSFKRIKELTDELAIEQKQLNNETTEAIEALFPIADDIYTRVVKTAAMTLKLSKVSPESKRDDLDVNAYIAELESKLLPSLGNGLESLKQKFITVKTVPSRKAGLSKPTFNESRMVQLKEATLMSKLSTWAGSVKAAFDKFLTNYDVKLDNLEQQINQLAS